MASRRNRRQSGFTLLEVMIALAILAGGLMILLSAAAANVAKTKRAQWLGVATDLARGKMYDIEELLEQQVTENGLYQELDQEEEGDFSDEGWKQITWKYKVEKVELPNLASMQDMAATEGEGAEAAAAASEEGAAPGGMLGGLLGMAGGGATGTEASGGAGAAMISSQYELLRTVLEQSIRKVTLTLSWKVGAHEESMVVNAYFTDPAAVNRLVPGLGGGGEGGEGGGEGGSGTGGSGTGGSGTGGSGTGGSGTGGSGTGGSRTGGSGARGSGTGGSRTPAGGGR